MSAVDQAQRLITAGQPAQAVALLEQAANKGDGACWLELGLLFLAGGPVPRDLGRSRDCISRAAKAGDERGTRIFIQFIAIGVGGEPDWGEAVNELREFAARDELAARQLDLIERMSLSSGGDPAKQASPRELSSDPSVWSFDRFFSSDECAYLIQRAEPSLQPSVIVDPDTGQLREHPVRTSYNMSFVWVSEDLVIQALNRRIAAASNTTFNAGEPLQILRYQPGQQFRPHFDAIDGADNQRVLTMLVYLNEDYDGGQTVFTHNGLTYRGRTGDGLLFRNATPEGARDEHAQHASLPIHRGEKWLASRWIRERPLVAS